MNEEKILIVRCGEVALKGMNKPYFERMLAERIKRRLEKAGYASASVTRHEGLFFVRFDPSLDQMAVAREISKVFGDNKSSRFINGVLDRIRRDLQNQPFTAAP